MNKTTIRYRKLSPHVCYLFQSGLQDLYNFKQENPHADLEPFLAKSSDYFRQYIERGLRTIELEVLVRSVLSSVADQY